LKPTKKKTTSRGDAYHEAGHAVVAWHLGVAVKSVSIVSNEDFLERRRHGSVNQRKYPEPSGSLRSVARMQEQVMIFLAGLIAQSMFSPGSGRSSQAPADRDEAGDIASHLTSSDEEREALIGWLESRTRGILRLHSDLVESLTKELLAKGSLQGVEVERLLRESSREA
jgi:ATP-dependent Zn protease